MRRMSSKDVKENDMLSNLTSQSYKNTNQCGKALWIVVLLVGLVWGFYFSRTIIVDFFEARTGSHIRILAPLEREEMEKEFRLAYCPTDFVDPHKSANVPLRVLSYGLLLIPDVAPQVIGYMHDALRIAPADRILKAVKAPVPSNFTLVHEMATEFHNYVNEKGFKTYMDFINSIAFDMSRSLNDSYESNIKTIRVVTEEMDRYLRYGTLCYDVKSSYIMDGMKYKDQLEVQLESGQTFAFDFIHRLPDHAPDSEANHAGDPDLFYRYAKLREVDHFFDDASLTTPEIQLSLSVGRSGVSERTIRQLDRETGMAPMQGAIGYKVSDKVLQARLGPNEYMLSGVLRFRVNLVKTRKVKDCYEESNPDTSRHTPGVIRQLECLEKCEMYFKQEKLMSSNDLPCNMIAEFDYLQNLSPTLVPCNFDAWEISRNSSSTSPGEQKTCKDSCRTKSLPYCSSYTYEATLMTEETLAKDQQRMFHLPDRYNMLGHSYKDRYHLQVVLHVGSMWTLSEYYLVTVESFIGGVGGILSLFLGMSLLTLLDICMTVLQLTKRMANRE